MAAIGTADISIDRIKTALGESSNDVGTLCKSLNINKWSLYAPFRSASLFHGSVSEMLSDLASKNYGFGVFSAQSSPSSARNMTYEKLLPRGCQTYNEPYRMGDFRNYNHSSVCPIVIPVSVSVPVSYETARFALIKRYTDYNVHLEQLPQLSDYYLAVILIKGDFTFILTSQNTIGSGAYDVILNNSAGFASPQVLSYYMVACSQHNTIIGTPELLSSLRFTDATYLPIPCEDVSLNAGTFTITQSASIIITLTYTRTSSTVWTLDPQIRVINGTFMYDVTVMLRGIRISNQEYPLLDFPEYTILAGQTVPSGTITSFTRYDFDPSPSRPSLNPGDRVLLIVNAVTPTGTAYNSDSIVI